MSRERFERIRDVYSRALEQNGARRAAFLAEACAEDSDLRREVESLLAEQQRMGRFMEEPALENAARNLVPGLRQSGVGKRIGHYEVLAFLDAGGMGEVYRSRDTKLKRDVAIKVLPIEWAQDSERVLRFKREAELLAALNHPHIAQIYGLEEFDNTLCLVLELVEGDTLAEWIRRGPIPLVQALEIASQIAAALEAAHDREIIHRDLKPSNIKFTSGGDVKVLDFGLAKATAPAAANASASQSPTLAGASLPGAILGTAGYMSPEQVRGRVVDTRTDIWAFGCVLYEMLTGKTAFVGESVVEILSAVLHVEPDWSPLPPSTPAAIRSLLKRCLQKERNKRLRHIADARFQIEEVQSVAPVQEEKQDRSRGSRERGWWIAAVSILMIAAIVLATRNAVPKIHLPEMRLQIVTPDDASQTGFSLSPDGTKLVFAAQNQLWLRPLESETAEPLPGTENPGTTFWSADGSAIAYSSTDHLKRFDLGASAARTLANVPAGVGTRSGSWNRNGNLLIGSPGDWMPLYLFAPGSTEGLPATSFEQTQTTQGYPYFLPDGVHFLFLARRTNGQGIDVGSIDSKETHHLFDADSAAVFAPPDYVLFARRGALLAQRIDLQKLTPIGEPVPLSSEVFVDTSVGSTSVRSVLAVSASASGTIAYRARGEKTQLAWVDRSGRMLGLVAGTERADIRQPYDLSLSPDGRTAAFSRTSNGNRDIWLVDLDRGAPRRFTFNDGWDSYPVWSPDGKQMVFSSLRKGVLDLYQKPVNGSEEEKPLVESREGKAAHDWSSSGQLLLYQSSNPQTSDDLWVLPLSGAAKPMPIVQTSALECCGHFSPDGKLVTYQSWETSRSEVYLLAVAGGEGKQRISTEGGVGPRFRPDGKELFYRAPDGWLMAVSIEGSGAAVKAGKPRPLFRLSNPVYVPSLDGQRFLISMVTEPASPITIVLNWNPARK